MKKGFISIILIIVLSLVFSSCSPTNYGKSYDSQEKLKQDLELNGINLLYPEFFPNSDYSEVKNYYIANYKDAEKNYIGYKIYCFSKPFNSAIYAYNYETDTLQCDDVERLEQKDNIFAEDIEIDIYQGLGDKDSLFIIGTGNIEGNHYECRIVGNEDLEDSEFINYIYADNSLYQDAIQQIKDMFLNIK